MVRWLAPLGNLFYLINLLLNKLSEPNKRYIHDQIEYEINHMRCKVILTIQSLFVIIFLTDMVFNGFSASLTFLRCIVCIISLAALISSCRYHPMIFKIFYNIFCLSYGPYLLYIENTRVYGSWFLTIILPLYFYVFVGDWKYFIFHTLIQMIYLNKLYIPIMENAVTFSAPQEIMKGLTYSTNISLVFLIALVTLTNHFMQHAYKRISVVEKKKDEIENQKNFLLGFSHELRNLLNSLTGNVKLASLENLSSKAKELLRNAEVCGELLLHLVNNILDTGKVEIGELEINPVPTRIYEVLQRIWGICSELIKRKNLGGRIRISKDIPRNLMIDHYRLTQIFLNLVGNSVKFTETGLIDISVDWLSDEDIVNEDCFQPYPFNYLDDSDEGLFEKQKNIESSLGKNFAILNTSSHNISLNSAGFSNTESGKGILKIVVSDTGCGMSEEEISKLFQKFSQVSSDTSKRKLGTGLGLFITKQLSQRMQGDIKAFSKKGCGSSFIFCVPADIVQEEHGLYTQDIDSLKQFVRSKKLRAMIVDDAPFNHAILKNFFDNLGVEVVDIAVNGREACQKYSRFIERRENIDIITMDIDMPIMDGKEAAKNVRRLEAEKKIRPCFMPIISGNCTESEMRECLDKSGTIKADRFIQKPATLEELLRAIGHHFASLKQHN